MTRAKSKPVTHKRSLARAQQIIERYTSDPAALGEEDIDSHGHTSEDRLGCSLAEHRAWMRTAPADWLHGWAQDWAEAQDN